MTAVVAFTKTCVFCKKVHEISLPYPDFQRWQGGEHIQNVFPEMNADQREVLISGTCPECWDRYMGEEE